MEMAMSRIKRILFAHLLVHSTLLFTSVAVAQTNKNLQATQSAKKTDNFTTFTGKVLANKVRVRSKADTDSHIIRQLTKGNLLLITGEEGDFWALQPPKETKAYVFRTYVLDGVVEANRVNVRLEPHIDAPIIAQLNIGDMVKGNVCPMNHKWLEIEPPSEAKFFISKEFIAQAGGPDYLVAMEKRKTQAGELLSSAFLIAEAECKKPFEEMSILEASEKFQTILSSFADFPEAVEQAKEGLALLKDTYLNKKISYLESRAELTSDVKEELLAKHREESKDLFKNELVRVDPNLWQRRLKTNQTDRMRIWDTIEESLYLSWTAFHTGKKEDAFYQEQRANASVLTGKVECYDYPVKNRPGDYVLRGPDAPIAYLYSTHIDLEKHEGKTITLLVSPRPNNHFAFPAYFVLSVE
jgi:hypothetical protein